MNHLTERQSEILTFLADFSREYGRPPTGPEIAEKFGFSDPSSAYQHIDALDKKGFVDVYRASRRSPLGIRLTERATQLLDPGWPVYGRVPAGPMSEAADLVGERIRDVQHLIPQIREDDYFLVVDGDSMIEAGMSQGDYVLVRPTVEFRSGDVCAVWVEGMGGTLKRVFEEEDEVILEPANESYDNIRVPRDHVRVQGVVVSVVSVREPHGSH